MSNTDIRYIRDEPKQIFHEDPNVNFMILLMREQKDLVDDFDHMIKMHKEAWVSEDQNVRLEEVHTSQRIQRGRAFHVVCELNHHLLHVSKVAPEILDKAMAR